MKRVLKWQVPVDDNPHTIDLPDAASIVHVACQYGVATVEFWTVVDATEHRAGTAVRRTFQVFGTGHPVPTTATYIGTALAAGGALVWHLFEIDHR